MISSAPALPELFTCARRNLRLTRPGRARLWLAAQKRRPAPWNGNHACFTCPIGAAHAGRTVAPAAEAVESIRMICPRCQRPTLRMIGDRFCPSCYNRQREVRIGRNCKGNVPQLGARLHAARLVVVDDRGVRPIGDDLVLSATEAMIAEARRAKGPVAFGRQPLDPARIAAEAGA